ncbi:MAG: FkbM family methyltransferase [Proteobacteria bacterium]|nr:FkbM family methyltransferase [Pseudomonadota bacterium]
MDSIPWTPRFTWEERFKYDLIPARLYLWRLLRKHWRKGEPEIRILPEIVPAGRMAIDVGANKGVYTHFLSRLASHVHAFEPNPKMHRLLTRTLPKNATAYTCALSDRDNEVAELIVPIYGSVFSNVGASLNPLMKGRNHGTVSVPTRTLDSFNFTNVGFLKVDVEGFEKTVFNGAVELIRRERPVIQVEMEEGHTGEPIEASHAFMAQFDMAGFFVRDGKLLPLSAFDADKDHRQKVRKPGYVNNFIFKPRR